MAPAAAALPWIIGGLSAATAATSIIAATRTPKPPEAPSGLDKTDQERKSLLAAYAQSRYLQQRQGAASTILTSPLGITTPVQTLKTQLGA